MNTITDAPYIAAEEACREAAQDLRASRPAVDAIRGIAAIDLTPAVAAQCIAAIRTRIGNASWAHFPEVAGALDSLDDAIDQLETP